MEYKNFKEIVRLSSIEIEIGSKGADKAPDYITLNLNPVFATELQVGDLIVIDNRDLEKDSVQIHNNWQNNQWRHFFHDALDMYLLTGYLSYSENQKLTIRIEGRSFYYGGEVMCLRGSLVFKNNL
ncbi:hypothetical protein [Phocaeicola sartorii]|uniref:Uncharacterized protein n=1 Tax=Phocaeicola sartorii TaxID=671267 RepID=A0A4S2FF66_9BACT|nr:hypothetical protein [Phocaeicola sartorii]TGY66821.1 hypothetical protein E5339_20690 [Phocaeicola sartorii]